MDAYQALLFEEADVIAAGAIEPDFDAATLRSFEKGDPDYNLRADEDPERAMRPFDRDRNGWVYSIGGGIITLEELDHAKARGARIYCEVGGFANLGELRSARRAGTGIERSMRKALEKAHLNPSDVDCVFADGSATIDGDEGEANAILRLFGNRQPAVTALKGGLGHMQGASSVANIAIAALSLHKGIIPPIKNLENPLQINGRSPDFVTETRERQMKAVVVNAINFHGQGHSSVVLKAYNGN